MRITMNMIAKQYSKKLNDSLSSVNYYSNRVTDNRKFVRTSEDPVAASQAFKIRREQQQNDDYTSNYEDINSKFLTGESVVRSVNTIVQNASSSDMLQGITGTMSSDDKQIIATKLRAMQQAIVSDMNTKYADQYIFGGSGTDTAPFTVDNGQLYYRGINVETGINSNGASTKVGDTTINFGKSNGASLNGYTFEITQNASASTGVNNISISGTTIKVELNGGGANNSQLQTALQAFVPSPSIAGADFSKITVAGDASNQVSTSKLSGGLPVSSAISNKVDLNELANESMYVDLGLGLNFKSDGSLNTQSVFDASMPGISFLGYGVNSSGLPNNLFTLMGKIADKLDSTTTPNFSIDDVQPYIDQFNKSEQNLLTGITKFGSKSNFLDYTKNLLDEKDLNLKDKDQNVEYVDPSTAIMDLKMQDYAYRATLQLGSQILQPTLLDFMK